MQNFVALSVVYKCQRGKCVVDTGYCLGALKVAGKGERFGK